MIIKAVLFDLDGTLLDTIEDLADSVNEMLIKNNFLPHKTESYKLFIGDGVANLIKRTLPENKQDESNISFLLKKYEKIYRKKCFNKTKPYPGIIELLDYLKNKKIELSIFSNKPDNFTQIIVKKYFKNYKFRYVIGAKKNQPIKPDPRIPLFIAEKLKIKPVNFLYLGDSGVDMQTAVNSGMFPAGAGWGFRGKEELLKNNAKIIFNHPKEILNFLKF